VNPDVAASAAARLAEKPAAVEPEMVELLASETLWALAIETSFGQAVAAGYAELAGEVGPEAVDVYRSCVREAGRAGATQGGLMAEGLLPVLLYGDADLVRRFRSAWAAMAGKGAYTLRTPLQALGGLLKSGDTAGAAAYLDLLAEAFLRDLAFEEARYFIGALPQAALSLASPRRSWQLAAVGRVLRADHRLVEPFLAGLAKGLGLLGEPALRMFVDTALRKHARQRALTGRHLALESRSSRQAFSDLQVRVCFAQVQDRLMRYLHTRTGRALALLPLSALAPRYAGRIGRDRMVCSDGAAIYVPDEIDRFERKDQNLALYAGLVRLEASFHEFGTIDFDLDKALAHCPSVRGRFAAGAGRLNSEGAAAAGPQGSDLERFFDQFPNRELAVDLFTVFELGRIRHCQQGHYPGLVARWYPLLRETTLAALDRKPGVTLCDGLLLRVALAVPGSEWVHPDASAEEMLGRLCDAFEGGISAQSAVEATRVTMIVRKHEFKCIMVSP